MSQSSARRAKRKSSILLKIIIVLVFMSIIAISAVGFISLSKYQDMKGRVEIDRIYKNIFVNGVNVGGMTKQEALDALDNVYKKEFMDKEITVFADKETVTFNYSDFNAKRDMSQAVEEAYSYARTGFIVSRYDKIVALETEPHEIIKEVGYSYDEGKLMPKLVELSEKVYIPSVDATIRRENGQFIVTDEVFGRQMNVEKTYDKVVSLLKQEKAGDVTAEFETLLPRYTAKEFATAQSLIGTAFSTFKVNEQGRNDNIFTAADKINNYVVYPGEVFSTNKAFGAMTYENGYRLAPVIIGGKLTDDFGGGVCQVSSTLYNALLFSELKIVERQNHSLKVGYMDYGFDATLAGDYIDLKFENDTKYPVFIETVLQNNNKLIVNIYGHEIHSATRRLEFKNALVEKVPAPAEMVTEDPTLPVGYRKVVSTAKDGYKYEVYKFVYENDVLVDKVLVNKSNYKPARAEVVLGTGTNVPYPKESADASSVAGASQAEPIPEASTSADPVEVAPAISQPVVSQPVVTQPFIPEPVATEPVISEPVMPE